MTQPSMVPFVVTFLVVGILLYVLGATSWMFAFRKVGLHRAWLAYVPILQYLLYLKVIRISRWNVLWVFLPLATMPLQHHGIVGTLIDLVAEVIVSVLAIWWMVRYFKAFSMNPHRLWWLLLPVIGWILIIIFQLQIGFSKKYQYKWG